MALAGKGVQVVPLTFVRRTHTVVLLLVYSVPAQVCTPSKGALELQSDFIELHRCTSTARVCNNTEMATATACTY